MLEAEGDRKEILNSRIHRSMYFDGVTYYLVSGFAAGDVWVRKAPGGELYSRDLRTGQEAKLAHLNFGVPAYETGLGGCPQVAAGAADPDLDKRLLMTYEPGECRDAGLSTDERAQLWLFVGTDSAYEGLTGLYYESVTVRLKEVE